MEQPVYAMLLAAGLSTRLKALSRQRPKPMMPVCNQPLIRWAAGLCQHHGIDDLVVNLHHLGEQIQQELGHRVRYSHETEILGTGGGIRAMAALMPRRTCVVVNAKIVTDLDLGAVLAAHRESGALATMVLRPDENAERWGAIGVDPSGRVGRMLELTRPGAAQCTPRMFTGVHVLEPEFIDHIPGGPCCVIRSAYQQLFEQGAFIGGYVHRGYFYEHSTAARYLQGNLNLLCGLAAPPAAPGPLTGVDPGAQVHRAATLLSPLLVGPGAKIAAGARVGPNVVLGPGATVAADAALSHAVVWDGCHVEGEQSRCIVTPQEVIQVPDEGDPTTAPR